MTKRILVPISKGFEEVEALTVVDLLRRTDMEVILAALTSSPVVGRSKIQVIADMPLDQALATGNFDIVVLPGGMPNAITLRDDERIIKAIKASPLVAAICAAPVALERAGLLEGKSFTSYPAMQSQLPKEGYSNAPVVIDKNVITSRGPGTAIEFALAIIEQLLGKEKADAIREEVVACPL